MDFSHDNLAVLAEQVRQGDPETLRERAEHEEGLTLLLRSALRSGVGVRQLVYWADQRRPPVALEEEPESAAPQMAHELMDMILENHCQTQVRYQAADETVG